MSMKKKIKAAVALAAAGVLALTACCGDASGGGRAARRSTCSAFSVMEAANEPVFEDFKDTDAGDGVEFEPSYGASGDQSRAVVAGSPADVVHYSLETDVTRLVGEGLVAEDWKDNATNGIATSSVVVFVVRAGNPDGIETLGRPGRSRASRSSRRTRAPPARRAGTSSRPGRTPPAAPTTRPPARRS